MCDPPPHVSPDKKWDLKSPTIFGAHKQPYTHTHSIFQESVFCMCLTSYAHMNAQKTTLGTAG